MIYPTPKPRAHYPRSFGFECERGKGRFALEVRPGGSAHVYGVNVEPKGVGLGRQMMREALGAAKVMGLRRLTLNVYEDNVAAQRCYEAVGFVPCSRSGGSLTYVARLNNEEKSK